MKTVFDPMEQKYPSQRYPIYAKGGMVNCSSPMASAAGLEALRNGGNAMDAAVAAAAALTVVEPTQNGIGADAFALIWSEKDKKLFGLNASGPAPMLASIERILADKKDDNGKMPFRGWTPVTVPGAPSAWAAITKRFGRRSLKDNLAPAVRYAREGYPLSPVIADIWRGNAQAFRKEMTGDCFKAWFDTFARPGQELAAGELMKLPDHADTLEAIGESGGEAFYRGATAKKIEEESVKYGGYIRYDDLAAFYPEWVEPISVSYRGYDVCEIPPNGQGIVALMALNILNQFDDLKDRDSAMTAHRQIEATKMAFADSFHYVTDPRYMSLDYRQLLSPDYAAARASLMTERAQVYSHGTPPSGGTVYMCCADGEGNMVSYIQSNYKGFGSGVVVAGTGIALQNRGWDFSLNPQDANALKPGKKTYHTIIPGFLMHEKKPVGPFGVMGGFMQPQGHVQVVSNYVDFHLNPQQSIDAPRWQWLKDGRIVVEKRFDPAVSRQLAEMGHEISLEPNTYLFGRSQMIVRLDNGILAGGTESRTDSNIACF